MGFGAPAAPPGETAKAVWEYSTRVLTNIPDSRAEKIDKIMGFSEVASGSLVADGTEQDLISVEGLGQYHGIISLHEMSGSDVVEVALYGRMSAGGAWRRYWLERYSRFQPDPLVHLTLKTLRHGFRVTLRQVSGVMRTFEYAFFKVG